MSQDTAVSRAVSPWERTNRAKAQNLVIDVRVVDMDGRRGKHMLKLVEGVELMVLRRLEASLRRLYISITLLGSNREEREAAQREVEERAALVFAEFPSEVLPHLTESGAYKALVMTMTMTQRSSPVAQDVVTTMILREQANLMGVPWERLVADATALGRDQARATSSTSRIRPVKLPLAPTRMHEAASQPAHRQSDISPSSKPKRRKRGSSSK